VCQSAKQQFYFVFTQGIVKHGVPAHVTSDQGSKFVSRFFCSLEVALNMKLHYTSGYYPEGDRQTKQTNQTLKQFLRIYCNYQQDNWFELLSLAEFAYNNALNSTTGISPFFANKGHYPNLSIHPERNMASVLTHQYVTDLDTLHKQLKENIHEAQKRYQGPADNRCSALPNL
jgi:hypothetical protein